MKRAEAGLCNVVSTCCDMECFEFFISSFILNECGGLSGLITEVRKSVCF